jgi:hypothetical protein
LRVALLRCCARAARAVHPWRDGVDFHRHRQAGHEGAGFFRRGIDGHAHRDALDDLGEVAGGILRRQQQNWAPVPGARLSTWPWNSTPGKASTLMIAGWPMRMMPIWVSLKLAET